MTIEKEKRKVYRSVFGNEFGKEVLSDLISYCRGVESTINNHYNDVRVIIDPLEMAALEGRRQVLLMILSKMQAKHEILYEPWDDPFDVEEDISQLS